MAFKPKKRQIESESDGEKKIAKKLRGETTAKKDLTQGKDAEGNPFWEIGKNRRISSSSYKGATLVNIREYYTAPDGELKPGKKGISLSLDQYNALLKVLPEINEELRSQGHDVGGTPVAAASDALVKVEKPVKVKKPKRANFDATSDEEEEEDEDDDE